MRPEKIVFKTWIMAKGISALIVTFKQNNFGVRFLEALTVSKQGLIDVSQVVQEVKTVWKNNTRI